MKWDVSKNENVKVFDPNLSYELTGYRPIDKTRGLDFNPEWFCEARNTKIRTGKYCQYPIGSKKYREFWNEEYRKCRDGLTLHEYTITGDHYFFLNFYQLKTSSKVKKGGGGRSVGFPSFYVTQYEYFHYLEMCRRLFKNACGLKARAVGFSEIGAAIVLNMYSTVRHSRSLIAAPSERHLKPTIKKCNDELNYLNTETDSGFLKLRQVKNTEMYKRSSHINKDTGSEKGFMSEYEGIVADDPNKVRGDRVDLLLHEEAGSNKNLTASVIQGQALVEVNGEPVGIQILWGTGGDSGNNLAGLAKIFNNPEGYNVLPFRHNYTQSSQYIESGIFIPAFRSVVPLMDNRGWCDPIEGKKYYQAKRDQIQDSQDLLKHCAEYCFTVEEALALEGENSFNKVGLAEQKSQIVVHKNGKKIDRGNFKWKFPLNQSVRKSWDTVEGVSFSKNKDGKVLIVEHPIYDASGNVPKNLYVAGIDSIDIGTGDTSAGTRDPSDFCIVVLKRSFGLSEPEVVAMYKDRPTNVKHAYIIALQMLMYYDCQAVLEATRVSILNFFKERKMAEKYLMRRPRATMNNVRNKRANTYGSPATQVIIKHQLELISDFTYDFSQNIWFVEMLDELLTYSYEAKTKFDIVAAFGMCLLGDEELSTFTTVREEPKEDWQDMGYYYDSQGIKRFGIIPQTNKMQIITNNNVWRNENQYGVRSSNPRLNTM